MGRQASSRRSHIDGRLGSAIGLSLTGHQNHGLDRKILEHDLCGLGRGGGYRGPAFRIQLAAQRLALSLIAGNDQNTRIEIQDGTPPSARILRSGAQPDGAGP